MANQKLVLDKEVASYLIRWVPNLWISNKVGTSKWITNFESSYKTLQPESITLFQPSSMSVFPCVASHISAFHQLKMSRCLNSGVQKLGYPAKQGLPSG